MTFHAKICKGGIKLYDINHFPTPIKETIIASLVTCIWFYMLLPNGHRSGYPLTDILIRVHSVSIYGSLFTGQTIVLLLTICFAIYHHSNSLITKKLVIADPCSTFGNVFGYRCVSDCRSWGRKFDPSPVPYFRGDRS